MTQTAKEGKRAAPASAEETVHFGSVVIRLTGVVVHQCVCAWDGGGSSTDGDTILCDTHTGICENGVSAQSMHHTDGSDGTVSQMCLPVVNG